MLSSLKKIETKGTTHNPLDCIFLHPSQQLTKVVKVPEVVFNRVIELSGLIEAYPPKYTTWFNSEDHTFP
jgi:hypothetical protein